MWIIRRNAIFGPRGERNDDLTSFSPSIQALKVGHSLKVAGGHQVAKENVAKRETIPSYSILGNSQFSILGHYFCPFVQTPIESINHGIDIILCSHGETGANRKYFYAFYTASACWTSC